MNKKTKLALKISALLGAMGLFSLFILKAPETHKDIIRSYVGNKTVLLRGDRSGGSGFLLTNNKGDTYIITNKHVCEIAFKEKNYRFLYAVKSDGTYMPRKILAVSETHDLCALESLPNEEGLSLATNLEVGQNIAIVGHPKLYPLQMSRGEFIGARIITLMVECQSQKLITPFIIEPSSNRVMRGGGTYCTAQVFSNQITAYSRGESSGSPVINFYGSVVGVFHFAGNRADQFDSYMVPLFELEKFVNKSL